MYSPYYVGELSSFGSNVECSGYERWDPCSNPLGLRTVFEKYFGQTIAFHNYICITDLCSQFRWTQKVIHDGCFETIFSREDNWSFLSIIILNESLLYPLDLCLPEAHSVSSEVEKQHNYKELQFPG